MNHLSLAKRTQARFVFATAAALAIVLSILPAGADLDDDVKSLIEMNSKWSEAAVSRDAAKVASFYAEDAIAYPPSESVVVGRPALQKLWSTYFSNATFHISWTALHAEVGKGGDLGYTTGAYQNSYKGLDGSQVNRRGKYVAVWKKQENGTWLVIHDIWNGDPK